MAKITYDSTMRRFSVAPDTLKGRTVEATDEWAFNFTDRFENIEPNVIQMLVTWILGDGDHQYDAIKKVAKSYDRKIDTERLESDIFDSCDYVILLNNPTPPNKINFKNPEFKSLYKRIVDYYNFLKKKEIKANRLNVEVEHEDLGLSCCLTSLMGDSDCDTMVYTRGDDVVLVILDARAFIRSLFKVRL